MSSTNITNLTVFSDSDGTLVPISFKKIIDFTPKRIFYIKDVPKNEERGNHAHYKTKQFLICLQGSVLIKTYDGVNKYETTLSKDQGILIDNLIWDSQTFLTGKDILLVLCSTEYDRADYIEDLSKFKEIIKQWTISTNI